VPLLRFKMVTLFGLSLLRMPVGRNRAKLALRDVDGFVI